MTLAGTNTYVVGSDPAWVIDPGPADDEHLAAVRRAAGERGGIGGVVLTHSHADHSAGVQALGAPLAWGTVSSGDEMGWARDAGAQPAPAAGESARGSVGPLLAIATPGHAADHTCFLLGSVCFCGDLILGEGSSIVPSRALGGSLAAYLQSLALVAELGCELLAPGHGPWITDPAARITAYVEHRLARERRLVRALERGERSRERLLDEVWDDVPAPLRLAAALAMQAHIEKLEDDGRLTAELTP